MTTGRIHVENGPGGRPAWFAAPEALIRADTAEELRPALAAAEAALASGHWIAGAIAYEAGYALEPRLAPLMPEGRGGPLLQFGVFADPAPAPAAADLPGDGDARLSPPEPLVTRAEHATAIAAVLAYIRAGDIYQANLTFPLAARWQGSPLALYRALARRQPVGQAALVELPGAPPLVSLSPELFFATDGQGGIEARPMKGTRPRAADPAGDAALKAELAASLKDRAENLMIVDLMRNDLSRLAETGSVRVPALYAVESYATVHQMIGRVTARLRPGIGLGAILQAIFPCGSITGAPKIRAMEILRALEPAPRGAYCGAIGWAGPGGEAAFNVAIRTLTLNAGGAARLGVGGGVVADSTAAGEWEEALWKTRFTRID